MEWVYTVQEKANQAVADLFLGYYLLFEAGDDHAMLDSAIIETNLLPLPPQTNWNQTSPYHNLCQVRQPGRCLIVYVSCTCIAPELLYSWIYRRRSAEIRIRSCHDIVMWCVHAGAVCVLHARSSCFQTDDAHRRATRPVVRGRTHCGPLSRTGAAELHGTLVEDDVDNRSTNPGDVDHSQRPAAASAMSVRRPAYNCDSTSIWSPFDSHSTAIRPRYTAIRRHSLRPE